MRASWCSPALAIVGQVLAWCTLCCAQPPDPEPSSTDPATPPAAAIESGLDVYYVKDRDGNLVPMVGFPLEDLEKLLEAQQAGAGRQKPAFRLERLVATGTAGGGHAGLSIQLTVKVSEANWVRVPLRLGGVVLHRPAEYEGKGEFFIEFDESGHEYAAWFRGSAEESHQLTLHVLVPLEESAGQQRLRLNAPRAVDSQLTLTVPLPRAVGQVSPGAVIGSTTPGHDSTEFKVLGLMSDFAISWRAADAPVAQVPSVLEATGNLLVRIDGHGVRTQAEFKVSSRAGKFGAFRIRLPPGATLVDHEQADYTLSAVSEAGGPAAAGRLFEVRKEGQPNGEAVVVRLVTEQTVPDQAVDLAGFDIPGAMRQGGHIAVEVDPDWQAAFGEGQSVRQIEVDELPLELRRGNLAAAFEFFGQPHSLPARVVPRKTTVSVEPRYLVRVEADRLLLQATLKYRVGGGRVFSLPIDLAGWKVDPFEIKPATLVKADAMIAADTGPLVIALAQPATGDLELTLLAEQQLGEATKVEFGLPWPQATLRGPAELVVQPANNVELTPGQEQLVGLTPQAVLLEPAADDQQQPWSYQAQTSEAVFAAGMRVLARQIGVEARTLVRLDVSGGRVEQEFKYNISHEAVGSLALDVPSELAESDEVQVLLDNRALDLSPAGQDAAGETVRMRVALPEKRIGRCELLVRYPLSESRPIPRASVVLKVPLVMPADGELVVNELEVQAQPGMKVQLRDTRWSSEQQQQQLASAGWKVSAGAPRYQAVLAVDLEDRDRLDATVVERAWVQTWLTEDSRADRAVYRFLSGGRQFALLLPSESIGLSFLLNGETVEPLSGRTADEWIVPLPRAAGSLRRHVLEVHYRFPDRPDANTRLSIQLPRLDPSIAIRRTYWQLVLPADEHVLGGPAGLTSEFAWHWNGFYWARRPLLEQPALEAWSGASPEAVLPVGVNRYLFSGHRVGDALELRLAGRSMLVLAASGCVLSVGLLLIYVPRLRHAGLLLAAAVATLAGALLAPETTLIVLEAATFGLVLALLAGILERRIGRRGRRAVLMHRGTSSLARSGSSHTQQLVAAPAPVSTETAAVGMELSAQDQGP
ncbi:MAG: hypothetical protein WD278_08855 [Pirellulales bacterium]